MKADHYIAGYKPKVIAEQITLEGEYLDEMMFWMYCPISVSGDRALYVPDNLRKFMPIIRAVCSDLSDQKFYESYLYITAKTLYVSGTNTGQRPGWHIDGYGSDDINYIWYTSDPTAFAIGEINMPIGDHTESLRKMELLAPLLEHVTYDPYTLLKLDQTNIHSPAATMQPGIRSFVKISVSEQVYNLRGNTVNHSLPKGAFPAPNVERQTSRNHPVG